jgi:predicted helicase
LTEKWGAQNLSAEQRQAAWNEYVPKHLLPRLFGYEIMMAPYAIAHMKISLKLAETGYRFETEERARVFLTNALEPWAEQPPLSGLDALAHEAASVNEVKRRGCFTVIIANPPYANFGQLNRNPYILGLLETYKRGLKEKKHNLDDDYIKFFRFCDHLIERTGCGVLGLISNSSYLDGATHRVMRKVLLSRFRDIEITNLHGNVRRKEVAPDGGSDQNVFGVIIQGVAIFCGSRGLYNDAPEACFGYADLWGARKVKLRALADSVSHDLFSPLEADPSLVLFIPQNREGASEYQSWPSICSVFPVIGQGIQTKQDNFCIALCASEVRSRVKSLKTLSESVLKKKYGLKGETPSWSLARAMADVRTNDGEVIALGIRPFDTRWTFYTGRTNGFHSRPRRASTDNMTAGNLAIVAKRQCKEDLFNSVWVTSIPINEGFFSIDPRGRETLFPLYSSSEGLEGLALSPLPVDGRAPNFHGTRFSSLGKEATASSVLAFSYAVFSSTEYRRRYSPFLKAEFPRIPNRPSLEKFTRLMELGKKLIRLHADVEVDPSGNLSRFEPESHAGRSRMETTGRMSGVIEKRFIKWTDGAACLNDEVQVDGIPSEIWNYQAGGYCVCEKWLKARAGLPISAQMLEDFYAVVFGVGATLRVVQEIDLVIGDGSDVFIEDAAR